MAPIDEDTTDSGAIQPGGESEDLVKMKEYLQSITQSKNEIAAIASGVATGGIVDSGVIDWLSGVADQVSRISDGAASAIQSVFQLSTSLSSLSTANQPMSGSGAIENIKNAMKSAAGAVS